MALVGFRMMNPPASACVTIGKWFQCNCSISLSRRPLILQQIGISASASQELICMRSASVANASRANAPIASHSQVSSHQSTGRLYHHTSAFERGHSVRRLKRRLDRQHSVLRDQRHKARQVEFALAGR